MRPYWLTKEGGNSTEQEIETIGMLELNTLFDGKGRRRTVGSNSVGQETQEVTLGGFDDNVEGSRDNEVLMSTMIYVKVVKVSRELKLRTDMRFRRWWFLEGETHHTPETIGRVSIQASI